MSKECISVKYYLTYTMPRSKQTKTNTPKKAPPAKAKAAPVKKAPPASKAKPAAKGRAGAKAVTPVEEPEVEEPELTPVDESDVSDSESDEESSSSESDSSSESEDEAPEEEAPPAKPAKGKATKGKAVAKPAAAKGKAANSKAPKAAAPAKGKSAKPAPAKGKAAPAAAKSKSGKAPKAAGSRQEISNPVITSFVGKALAVLQGEGKIQKTESIKIKNQKTGKVENTKRDVRFNISKSAHAPVRELFGSVIDSVAIEVGNAAVADAKKTVSPEHVVSVAESTYELSKDDLSSSEEFILAKAVVERRVRAAIDSKMDKLRFSKEALETLQRLLEHIFVNLSTLFLLSAHHGKRKTLQGADIEMVARVRASKY